MRHSLPEVMMIIWGFSVLGNVILTLLLVGLRHYVRWGWLTLWCASSVLIDFLAWYGKFSHGIALYPHFWLITRYVWTFFIEFAVIFEGWKWKESRVEFPVSIQLLLGILSLSLTKSLGYTWTVYYLECFSRIFNLFVIGWMIYIFRKEPFYE